MFAAITILVDCFYPPLFFMYWFYLFFDVMIWVLTCLVVKIFLSLHYRTSLWDFYSRRLTWLQVEEKAWVFVALAFELSGTKKCVWKVLPRPAMESSFHCRHSCIISTPHTPSTCVEIHSPFLWQHAPPTSICSMLCRTRLLQPKVVFFVFF